MTLWLVLAILALLLALSVYPAELSWFSTRATRWLYDRAAANYDRKWQRHDYQAYDALIEQAARAVSQRESRPLVLDLGCGSGRATEVAARTMGSGARYIAVDFSPRMLAQLAGRLRDDQCLAGCDITLVEADIGLWLQRQTDRYDLVLCMEVGEFLPEFRDIVKTLGRRCNPGAQLVMTRPAGLWHLFFLGRGQSRHRMLDDMQAAGFISPGIQPWRKRYELLRLQRIPPPAFTDTDCTKLTSAMANAGRMVKSTVETGWRFLRRIKALPVLVGLRITAAWG